MLHCRYSKHFHQCFLVALFGLHCIGNSRETRKQRGFVAGRYLRFIDGRKGRPGCQ
ncbi:hypothetical protein B0T17DRAFT_530466 [Bombardia bombarda]|uniref:Uncharacterized protein n=1 Tax=Bombardia bombarda TaxID=252184 RepID=A0AA39WZL7_9PEZI|nr:hypothetical protein B0T17DRAFT_530466 [Bombardia bombarda]